MIWEGAREIEEADQSKDHGQIEDNASRTDPSNDAKVSLPFCVRYAP